MYFKHKRNISCHSGLHELFDKLVIRPVEERQGIPKQRAAIKNSARLSLAIRKIAFFSGMIIF